MVFWQILSGILGCFLLVWSINLRRMSVAQRPRFSRQPSFRFSAPLLGGGLGLAGFGLAIQRSLLWGGLSCAISFILCWLLLKHDRYSAVIRILYDDYLTLKKQNPQSKEFDLLFSIVNSRYPRWSEDRMMEICAGKDIRQLVLLLLLIEYEIHPLNDMRLYEKLKARVDELYPQR